MLPERFGIQHGNDDNKMEIELKSASAKVEYCRESPEIGMQHVNDTVEIVTADASALSQYTRAIITVAQYGMGRQCTRFGKCNTMWKRNAQ